MKIDKSLAGWAVAALFILCAFVAVVLLLTPAPDRGGLIRIAAGPLGGLVAALGGLIAARSAHGAAKETAAQTPVIAQIQHQTNGVLSERIANAVNDALASRGLGTEPAAYAGAEYVPEHADPATLGRPQ